MYDINLFERYKVKPKKTSYLGLILILFLLIFIAIILFLEFRFRSHKNELESQIKEFEAFSENSEIKESIKEIDVKTQRSVELSKVLDKLSIVDKYVSFNNLVYEGLLTDVSKAVPDNCFLNTVNISQGSINLKGYADGYESVANFQHRLRKTDKIMMLFNPSIAEENANYAFNLAGIVKMEVTDEN